MGRGMACTYFIGRGVGEFDHGLQASKLLQGFVKDKMAVAGGAGGLCDENLHHRPVLNFVRIRNSDETGLALPMQSLLWKTAFAKYPALT